MAVALPVPDALHPRHRAKLRRVREEAARLTRWAEFRRRYDAACAETAHGDRTALRLEIGEALGMDDRETRRALYGG